MISSKNLINFSIYFSFLIFIDFVLHFLPFERLIISPDDFAYLLREELWLKNFLEAPDRPIRYIWQDFQNNVIGTNPIIATLFLFFSSIILIFSIFIFLSYFLKNLSNSFFISLLYILISTKTEIYSSSTFIHINLVTSFYIFSILFFIISFDYKNNTYFILSIIFYTISILWYEIGFFIPIIYVFYIFINKSSTSNIIKYLSPYLVIIVFYFIYRFNMFDASFINEKHGHHSNLSILELIYGFYDVINIFFGRSFFRTIIYGTYYFFQIKIFWQILYFVINIIVLFIIFKYIYVNFKITINRKKIIFFLLLLFISIIPNILNSSMGGRHAILGSISISFFLFILLNYFFKKTKFIMSIVIFYLFIISQGNTWTQIDSLRIQEKIYSYFESNRLYFQNYRNIIFDRNSFAININHSFFDQEYNKLRTFYGAQCLEDWGLSSMIVNINQDTKTEYKFYVAEKISADNQNILSIDIGDGDAYRKILTKNIVLNNSDSKIIKYENIFLAH